MQFTGRATRSRSAPSTPYSIRAKINMGSHWVLSLPAGALKYPVDAGGEGDEPLDLQRSLRSSENTSSLWCRGSNILLDLPKM